jgi:hypothetical protein
MMLQVAQRSWPAAAVHDTVEAVVRGAAFRRSLQSSIAERLFTWLMEWLTRFARAIHAASWTRTAALVFVAALVLLVVARLALSARARGPERTSLPLGRRGAANEDPWLAAERLRAEGRYEESAHALYRGVLSSLAQSERLRLDRSKTSGDYARELRARGSSAYGAFRVFSRRFDVAVYGHGTCDAALIDDLTRLAVPLRARARAA